MASLGAGAEQAQPVAARGLWIHLGAARVAFDSDARVEAPALDGVVPGQSATASDNTAVALELGAQVVPNWIVSVTVGIPPVTRLTGAGGPFDGVRLGEVRYEPAVLSLHRHWDLGGWRPYAGAGATYVLALESRDAALTGLEVRNALGTALQLGADVPLGPGWGLFVDAKKLLVRAKASFSGPTPGTAHVRLDPLIVHAGLLYRF